MPRSREDLVGLGRRRAVRGLDDQPAVDPVGVLLGDLLLERGRDQDVARRLEDLAAADRARRRGSRAGSDARRPRRSTAATSRPSGSTTPPVTSETPTIVAPRCAQLAHDDGAHVAEALDDDALPVERSAAALAAAASMQKTTPSPVARRAGLGAAEHDRLAGDDLGHRVADLLRVGVHEPRHLALAGGHVGRRDVAVGTDDREELRRRSGA